VSDDASHAAAIEATVDELVAGLRVWAQHMAARYNGPVYLLGSVLHSPVPRDVDIRIVVQDHEFAARYGATLEVRETKAGEYYHTRGIASGAFVKWDDGPTQRWVDDVAKFTAVLSRKHKHNFDVQVWPASYWRDGVWPTPVVLAEPSPRWVVDNKYKPAVRQ
jgi:hypothetical protein